MSAPAPAPGVAFVIFQTGSAANGGVESATAIVERLAGVRVLVVTQAETAFNERWRRAGAQVRVWRLPYTMGTSRRAGSWRGGALARAASILSTNLRFWRLLRRQRVGVVHCNDVLAVLHAGFGARLAGARLIHNVRGVKPAGERYGARWRLAHRLAHHTVVLSREMRDDLAARALPRGGAARVRVIRTGVDLARLAPCDPDRREALRRARGIAPDEVAIGYVAAMNPLKGQLAFAEQVIPALRDALPSARVYFVGGPDPRDPAYAERCRAAAGAAAHFVDYTDEIADWYRAFDLVVLASRSEGLARCMLEAMASGTPMVSFDVCSAREVLEENACGIVVPQGDYAGMASALAALGRDPALRERLGRAGAAAARELFDPERMVAEYRRVYLPRALPLPAPAAVAGWSGG